MAFDPEIFERGLNPSNSSRAGEIHTHAPMLSPPNAWRILRRRTGGHISRSTFYRWLDSGKVHSFRMGSRMYVPCDRYRRLLAGASAGNPSEDNSSREPRETVRPILRQEPQPMFVQHAKLCAFLMLRQAELRFQPHLGARVLRGPPPLPTIVCDSHRKACRGISSRDRRFHAGS